MAAPHDFWLVCLSIAIAMQGSYVGLSLAGGVERSTGVRRRLALAGSAVTLATGIWSMHFVGMLAASFPSAVDYLALPTLLSFLICVIVVGCGVFAATAVADFWPRILVGAVAMGLGISAMHYVGMSAVHLAGPIHNDPAYVAASVVVSIAASAFALYTLGSRPDRTHLFLGAVVLGLAISGMHHTAMAGMRLDPLCFDASHFVDAPAALSRNALALLATFIAFGVSGAFLLSLVPDAPTPSPALAAPAPVGPDAALFNAIASPALIAVSPAPAPTPIQMAPVEKDGRSFLIAISDIVAVRANAHYTYVHDGEQEYFCGKPIGAWEADLAGRGFMRVHRSHLVRVDRVTKVKRSGESWSLELDAAVRCTIPVARGQQRELKRRLAPLFTTSSAAFHEVRQHY